MITWGTYSTKKEAEAVIARSGYPPGRLTVTQVACPRTGAPRWVLKLAYARHLPFPAAALPPAQAGGGAS